ncbi:FecR family protein, partial [Sphingomonas asaccharolytica]|uniref:FecR family protein n=1 Tax=Sphingomonas asaccharolytica TaxID=40681 RepID=UPI000A9F655E
MNVFAKAAMRSLALCLATPAWAQSADWTVSEASGRVVVRDAAGDHPVVRGTAIRAGTTLLTGVSSRAVLVRGEDFVTVSAASRIRVPDAKAPGMVQMFLEWGTGLFKVKHTDKPHFGVQTPYLAAVVKGTTFTVTVGQDGTSLQVIDGAVGVATIDGGANELIRPGMVAMISSGDRYRLSVQGQQSRVIDSPQRETAPAGPSSEAPPAPKTGETNKGDDVPKAADAGPQKGQDDFAWSDVSDSVIIQPIEAKPVDIGAATGGLVSNDGNSSTSVAVVAVVPVARGKDGGDGAGAGKGSGDDGKSTAPGGKGSGDDKGAEPGKGS